VLVTKGGSTRGVRKKGGGREGGGGENKREKGAGRGRENQCVFVKERESARNGEGGGCEKQSVCARALVRYRGGVRERMLKKESESEIERG